MTFEVLWCLHRKQHEDRIIQLHTRNFLYLALFSGSSILFCLGRQYALMSPVLKTPAIGKSGYNSLKMLLS
ncbi:hypothetical protein JTE90_029143 [Oedothorax gibbosus]|uniref:Uncharacterized protein n=1 Tax=Oedothorax gibbosus TaxID=931172 RepID=A0AAV6UJX5_9ARAC|nr:hypothetical protein JTE90_029143 [Oedothorax gibbosus]